MGESNHRWRRVDEIFALAVETPPEERAAVLERACGADPELRREVERLLAADGRAQGFLETPAGQLWLGVTATADGDGRGGPGEDTLAAGQVLGDRYRILSLLGKGGMGAVYRAHDEALGNDVAVKVLSRRRTRDPARVDAFRREVKLARRVSHPNVCRVHDFGEDGGSVFLTMEYVEGESLAHRLRQGALDPASCQRVLHDVARGLAAAHAAGVVHRDLKPENVILRLGTNEAVVVDFGIAAQFEDEECGGLIAGTRGYMSPEQRAGRPVDARSDVYALGILTYQAATGQLPAECRQTATAEELAHRAACPLPPALGRLVSACLREDPAERPEDAAATLRLFEAALAPPAGSPPRSWRRAALVATALGLLALTATSAGLWWAREWPQRGPASFVLAPFDTSALDAEEAPTGEALRSLIRNELLDAWGVKAGLREGGSRSQDVAWVAGRVRREEGRPTVLLRIRRGWASRELHASGRSLHELAERAATLLTEANVPRAERRPTPGDLRALGTSDAEAWRLLRRARRMARFARWHDARARLRAALDRDPAFALAWIELAMTYNDGDQARREPLAKGVELARRARGLGALSSSLAEFARSWQTDDLTAQARIMRSFDRLPLDEEERLYAGTRVAIAFSLRDDLAMGLALMEWVAETWPEDGAAHKLLASYHLSAGEMGYLPADRSASLALALRHARRSVALAPEDAGARVNLARTLLLSGDREGAARQVGYVMRAEHEEKQAADSASEHVNNLFALHMALGDWDAAGVAARRMLVSTPGRRASAGTALAILDLNRGALDRGLDEFSEAVEEWAAAGLTITASEDAWELCLHAFRLGRYGRAREACARARSLCESSVNKADVRRASAAAALMRVTAARMLDEPARGEALARLRASIAELPPGHPERSLLELHRRYAAQDWAGVEELFQEMEGRPDAVRVAVYAADALEHLGREKEARRVDEWFSSHPNAWRYPDLRVRLTESQPSTFQ